MSMPHNELLTIFPGREHISYEQMNTIFSIEKLWVDLSFWIRDLSLSTNYNLPNLHATTNQVMNVMPMKFYNSLRVFYGPEIAQLFLNNLTNLLANILHLMNAYKEYDKSAVDSSTVQLYQSADTFADLLSRINIYWDKNQWKYLFRQYAKLNISQIVVIAGQSNNHDLEMNLFYQIQDLSLIEGSYMARGIIADKSVVKRLGAELI